MAPGIPWSHQSVSQSVSHCPGFLEIRFLLIFSTTKNKTREMLEKLTNVVRNNKILNISLVYSLSQNQDVLSFQFKIGRKMQHLHNPQKTIIFKNIKLSVCASKVNNGKYF